MNKIYNNPVYVTKPALASLELFQQKLASVWESGILTHNGPLVQSLEKRLIKALSLKNLSLVTNGTIALQIAIKALELKGKIITSPFSWIATVSAIKWENCHPIFCDVNKDTFNIDPERIEELITDDVKAIMPVHVFGNPCEVKKIEKIAKKHDLKVIYDAAHALGSECYGTSVLNFGDISATSLHATKLLNTGEGGACITTNNELNSKIERIRFFGHNEHKDVIEDGFNGKLTEIHAALGHVNLDSFEDILQSRKKDYTFYSTELAKVSGLQFQKLSHKPNYSYFPVVFESESDLLNAMKKFQERQIYPRRYFYPSLNTYKNVVDYFEMPVSESLSRRIICLPLYWKITKEEIERVVEVLKNG